MFRFLELFLALSSASPFAEAVAFLGFFPQCRHIHSDARLASSAPTNQSVIVISLYFYRHMSKNVFSNGIPLCFLCFNSFHILVGIKKEEMKSQSAILKQKYIFFIYLSSTYCVAEISHIFINRTKMVFNFISFTFQQTYKLVSNQIVTI